MTDEPQAIEYRAAQKRHDDLRATVEIVTAVAVRLAPDQLPELEDDQKRLEASLRALVR